MATEEKTAMLGFLKWELSIKSNKQFSILLCDFEKELASLIDAAAAENLKSQSAWTIIKGQFPKKAI